MEKIKRIIWEYRVPFSIAILHWYISTVMQFDRAFFDYSKETHYFLITKAAYLVTLIAAWSFVFFVYKKINNGDARFIRGIKIFLFYYSIMLALMLALWPGTWSWDDLWTLSKICTYKSFDAWQHVLTGVYQCVLLQILPFPGGIILLQNALISLCVAYVVVKLEVTYSLKRITPAFLDVFLKICPFLLLPVLFYQFSGYRMGLYVYLELVMMTALVCAPRDAKEWSWKYLGLCCFLIVLVSAWRTESFLYIPCAFILILFIRKEIIPNSKKIVCILLIFVGFLTINRWQDRELGDSNYKVISLLRPCAELIRVSNQDEDAAELLAINKVIDLEIVYDNPMANGEELYWTNRVVRTQNDTPDDDYSQDDYNEFLKAIVRLSIKYPRTVIAERWNVFLLGCGITGHTISYLDAAATLYDEDNDNNAMKATFTSHDWIATKPVFTSLRKATVFFLGGRNADGINTVFVYLVWNALVPILFLLYAWVKLLVQKKWYLWCLCSAVVAKLPVIVLTEPAGWFMYFLSFYLLGYTFAVYDIWIHYSRSRGA